jgi:cytochrome c peroxidase
MRGARLSLAVLAACGQTTLDPPLTQRFATPFSTAAAASCSDETLAALPPAGALDLAKVALGKQVFEDPRVSGDGRVACSHCHALDHGGAIPERFSNLPGRKPVAVNVPSVFNAAFNARFAWNGRFTDLGEQLDFTIGAPAAMAGSWQHAAEALEGDAAISGAFAAVYPGGVSPGAVREVLALYTLSLATPSSRFDRFLCSQLPLIADEQRGYELFSSYGCSSCHQGSNLGGNLLQRFGVVRDYFEERGRHTSSDDGLFEVTHDNKDKHVFRVPSLRNVALTAPYFHDGSAPDLATAVRDMARFQLGRTLSERETGELVAFLETLSGELGGVPL